MRKLMLLLAAGSLWLFLAAVPVFADGGPHVSATNSGASSLTSDSCAGCHRAHTAKGEYLINKASEEELCLGCHGAGVTGASVNVEDGVQYAISGSGLRSGTVLGATRAGGFVNARIGDPGRLQVTASTANASPGYKTKVTALGTGTTTMSAHIVLAGSGATGQGIAWGSGANGSGVGATLTLECVSCHNPHGNGQYRILNPVPNAGDITAFQAYGIASVDADLDLVRTTTAHEFQPGDVIRVSADIGGLVAGTSYTVVNVPAGTTFQVGSFISGGFTATDLSAAGAGATTVSRYQAIVTDGPLGTADVNGVYPERNYTIMQVKGTQGTDASYMLYAQNVLDARTGTASGSGYVMPGPGGVGTSWPAGTYTDTGGDYWHRQVPWNAASGSADDAPNGRPATNPTAQTGAVGFNFQITAWCTSCHTRYYAQANPNPGTLESSSGKVLRGVAFVTAGGALTMSGSPGVIGDTVTINGVAGITNGDYVIQSVTSGAYTFVGVASATAAGSTVVSITAGGVIASGISVAVNDLVAISGVANGVPDGIYKVASTGAGTFTVAQVTANSVPGITVDQAKPGPVFTLKTFAAPLPVVKKIGDTTTGPTAGTAIRASLPQTAQSWWFPRQDAAGAEDPIYTYQHRTIPNRACTSCHVAHGSNRDMTGAFSSTFTRPDQVNTPGSAGDDSSRLLKIDNRGTCQGCHDPTGTWAAANIGVYKGAAGGNVVP